MDIRELLQRDHREVETLFQEIERVGMPDAEEHIDALITALEMHAMIEEKIFYPDLEPGEIVTNQQVQDAYSDHAEVKEMIAELRMAEDDGEILALVTRLKESVQTHVQEEESVLFKEAERALGRERLVEAGQEAMQLRQKIESGQLGKEDMPDTVVGDEEQPPAP